MKKKISVVVPVYYNAESLPGLFAEFKTLEKKLASLKIHLEEIYVDDGSGDNSMEVLLRHRRGKKNVKVIKLTRNFGVVHAAKIGFDHVTGDAFVAVAADLQDPPNLVFDMAKHWLKGAKFVICERSSRKDPLLTRLYSRLYYILLRALVIPDYPVGGFDMSLMDKVFLKHMVNSSKSVFTPLLAYWLGYKPVVIEYDRPERLHGKSRWTFMKKVNSFLDIMVGFSITPIRLISAIGAAVSIISITYGLVIVVNALLFGSAIQGFPTIITLISFLLGLVILMLGIIGEYLWRIFSETNRRPSAVIDEVY